MATLEILRAEVSQFQSWADTYFLDRRHGEWETEYDSWDDLHKAAIDVLESDTASWGEETCRLLIYAIARDNEVEFLASRLTEEHIRALQKDLLRSDEWHAKWQIAVASRKFALSDERENLLRALAKDPDEYVRRRSIGVLAELGSVHAEPLAISAWNSGNQYQQMMCLSALHDLDSPLLDKYLKLAKCDARPFLSAFATKIENKTDEYSNLRSDLHTNEKIADN
jgi:hypothetical protein